MAVSLLVLLVCSHELFAGGVPEFVYEPFYPSFHVALPDTGDLPLPHDNDTPSTNENPTGGVSLGLPSNVVTTVEYDPITGEYIIVQKIGDMYYRPPSAMGFEDYINDNLSGGISEYWQKQQEEERSSAFAPQIKVGEGFSKIFGSEIIEIRPQGSAEITLGINVSKTDNPLIPERQRRIATFDFQQRIQLNAIGKIGTKMTLNFNFNTEATFNFENQMKLEYVGEEDEIIKRIEAGNVSLPLKGSLITGSQSLLGLKVETQWGRLRNTTIFSQQNGEKKEITVEGGAQTQTFDIRADNYEANRHFFLSQFFRDQYDEALASLPVVNSPVNITRIEVWVVNRQANTENVRNIVAFTDIGEHPDYISSDLNIPLLIDGTTQLPQRYPDNDQNDIYQDALATPSILEYQSVSGGIQSLGYGMNQGDHFELLGNARMLNSSEYSYNARLGFVSLRQSLNNDEVLAVSYEYTLNGETYQVGTLSQDGITAPNALMLKMLKSTIVNVENPLWDLMMKNVYNLGAFGLSSENFRLDLLYNNPATGVDFNFIPRDPIGGELLIQVLGMDKLDINQQSFPDGVFDYIDNAATQGGTIDSNTGRVFFPSVEPFGETLAEKFREGLPEAQAEAAIQTVVYQPLYDSTKTAAQQIPALNRFRIRGQYQSSSSSEIALNAFNIPQGSVTVTSGGVRLVENQDYQVDYNLGRVRILNEGVLQSGAPINVALESNSLFNVQTKTLMGSRFDYLVSDNINVGATILNLRERPITQKVNIGDEPVNNTLLGLDGSFQTESGFLTRMVDRIPFIDTKEKSNISVSAEAAYLIPGHSRAIGDDGNAYLDDFEGSQSTIDLRSLQQWFLASTPKGQPSLFPEGNLEDDLRYNYNRALLSWYIIDPLFFRNNNLTPDNVDEDMRSNHFMRQVLETEVFPRRVLATGTPPNTPTLDLSFYPEERGQYNYELPAGSNVSAGFDAQTGLLESPEERWGGIQRALTTTDFEVSNIEFIQFWLMDPFNEDSENETGGDLYFNLGGVSEDVLNDSQLSYENGYPTANQPLEVDEGTWGFYPDPSTLNIVNAFDNSLPDYTAQDIGIDGLTSAQEADFFEDWLAEMQAFLTPAAYSRIAADPSADDYANFRSSNADAQQLNTLERYKRFNGYEGNSDTRTPDGYPISATTIPSTEDINKDLTLKTSESYYQYRVSMRPQDLGEGNIGRNFITDSFETTVNTDNGEERSIRWYQFRVPIREFESRVGGINDFRAIRYMRVFMKGFREPATLRFARLELVRGEWRRYLETLQQSGEEEPNDDDPTTFNIAAVNVEENGNREPVNYVEPPGIVRELDVATPNNRPLNEQALSLTICNLQDGDSRAAYRNVNFDMRQYRRIKMFVHAESAGDESLQDNDLTCFIRLGSDFDENYYEYEIPLKVTPWGETAPEGIWPEENEIDIAFQRFTNLKTSRPADFSALQPFVSIEGEERITVKGNPNLGNVITVMVGVRNPRFNDNPFDGGDDGLPKCTEVWINELRLSEFDERGGWAAIAQMSANLADFANVAVAANISTPGFGTLEQTVQDRQQETIRGIDASSTIQLGKFFPEDAGVQIPMFLGFSEAVSIPRFDPLQPDIEFNDLDNLDANVKRDRVKRAQEFTKRRSINFTNVRIAPKKGAGGKSAKPGAADVVGKGDKGKGGGGPDKPRFYNVSNFSLNYAYNEIYTRDINFDFDSRKNYRAGVNYSFNNRPAEIKPFSNIGFIKKSKNLKFLKDFNFYTGLKSVGFNTQMDRMYQTNRLRNNQADLPGANDVVLLINTQVLKTWTWNRQYNLKYDLTKSLKFDFSANNGALVGEPQGLIDRNDQDRYEAYKDSVLANITNLGETTSYDHSVRATYKLPLDKFPIIDFMSADASYTANYRWQRAPFSQDSLGNTIQNSRTIALNGQANFNKLYDKVEYLKNINKPPRRKKRETSNQDKDGFGDEEEEKKKKEKEDRINPVHVGLRFLMMVKNASASYNKNEGLLLPGYNQNTRVVGMDPGFTAPGVPFILGQQNTDVLGRPVDNFATQAAENGWLVNTLFQNQQYTETFSESFNGRINLEPIRHLKVEINLTQTSSRGYTSFFRFDENEQDFVFQSPVETGNFSTSINTWGTAFIGDNNAFDSETFQTFLSNRREVSERLSNEFYPNVQAFDNGFYEGFGPTSQQTVIPAFIAAYTGKEARSTTLNPFGVNVQPNWRITYDGLSKLPSVKKRFKSFNLNHAYRSTLTTSYVTNLNYEQDAQGRPTAFDQSEDFSNYIPERQINAVTISEQLSPLIGLDMTIKTANNNNPQIRVEWKKDRTINLGLANYQITENKSNALVIGAGYTIPEIPNPFRGKKKKGVLGKQMLENTPLNLRADLTIRDNSTIIRRMVEQTNQVTAGQTIISIKTSADLSISKSLTLRFFYDQQLTRPKISTSFPTSNINSGLAIRFTLTQ